MRKKKFHYYFHKQIFNCCETAKNREMSVLKMNMNSEEDSSSSSITAWFSKCLNCLGNFINSVGSVILMGIVARKTKSNLFQIQHICHSLWVKTLGTGEKTQQFWSSANLYQLMVLLPNPACDFRGSKVLILLIHKMQVDYHNLLHPRKTTLTCKDSESTAVYLFIWTKAFE